MGGRRTGHGGAKNSRSLATLYRNELLVAERNSQSASRLHQFAVAVDHLQNADGFLNGYRLDRIAAQADHATELTACKQFHSGDSEACAQHAIERRRRSTALNVAQHRYARLPTGLPADPLADGVRD